MDDHSRSTVFYVQNSGDVPTEVAVALSFGYPASDSLGGIHMELIESPGPDHPSAADWVRALPRRIMIQPGERQAVRLLAQPPADLPPGEYWSRIIVTSQTTPPPRPVAESGQIQVGLTLQTRTIISLSYRKAQVSTGISLRGFGARIDGEELIAELDLARTGNAAYLGDVRLVLTDDAGTVVQRFERVIAVYYELYRVLSFPVGSLPPGVYRLHLNLSTVRNDIPQENILPAEPVEADVEVTVP
jgi:hypothetical protein